MLQLNGNFQPAEDKAIGRFVGIIRGPAGTGKSSLLGSAYNTGHSILVADIENKGWGKYPGTGRDLQAAHRPGSPVQPHGKGEDTFCRG